MVRRLYSLAGYCALPLLLVYLWWRGRADPHYRLRWSERFGHVGKPRPATGAVLVHCGSVGEVLAKHGDPEIWDPEGNPVKADAADAAPAKPSPKKTKSQRAAPPRTSSQQKRERRAS